MRSTFRLWRRAWRADVLVRTASPYDAEALSRSQMPLPHMSWEGNRGAHCHRRGPWVRGHVAAGAPSWKHDASARKREQKLRLRTCRRLSSCTFIVTESPAPAHVCATPLPMVPAPMTPIDCKLACIYAEAKVGTLPCSCRKTYLRR